MVGFAQKYDSKAGVGTVVALMLPYVIWISVIWTILFVIWYLLGLPWGDLGEAGCDECTDDKDFDHEQRSDRSYQGRRRVLDAVSVS